MKTHYAQCDRANESDNQDYWSRTTCGLEECESPMTEDTKYVTCKNCLKVINRLRRRIVELMSDFNDPDNIEDNKYPQL